MKRLWMVVMVGSLLFGAAPVAKAAGFPSDFCKFTARMKRAPSDPKAPPMKRLAIMPFTGEFGVNASHIMMDTLNSQNNDFEILDREHMQVTDRENELLESGKFDPATMAQMGKRNLCQAIIVGSLDHWGASVEECPRTKLDKNPMSSTFMKSIPVVKYKEHINVTLNIQMIDVEHGWVISPTTRQTSFSSEELEDRPSGDSREKLLGRLLNDTIWEFVKKISPYKVYVDMGLHKAASEEDADKLIRYLNADRTDKAIEIAWAQQKSYAKKDDKKAQAAGLYNLGIVYEIADSLEMALKFAQAAQDTLLENNEKAPNPYGDACRRIKGEIADEKNRNSQGTH